MLFNKKEEEMFYNACLSYGNQLSDMAKKITEVELANQISNKAKEYYELASKIVKNKGEKDT